MNDINKVTLTGRLGGKPRLYEGKNDKKLFAVFSLATQESYKGKDEEWKQKETVWHNNILVFNPKLVELTKTFNKGALLKVTGALSYKKFSSRAKGKTVKKDEACIIARTIDICHANSPKQTEQMALTK